MAIFPTFFFSGNIDQENVFYDVLERKNAFLGYKNKKFKQFKNWHFSNPRFWSKNGHFSNFFFLRQYRQGKCLLRYSRRKNAFLGYQNKTFKKSKNWHFSNPWFRSKNGHFSNFFFLSNIYQETVFYDVLERKNAFLGYENKKFKESKNWHFCSKSRKFDTFLKGLTHGLGPKMAFFPTFFFLKQYKPGKCLLRYSRTKNASLGYKNKKFKKSKNWHFL